RLPSPPRGLCPRRHPLYRLRTVEEEAVIPRPPTFVYMRKDCDLEIRRVTNDLSAKRQQGGGRRDGDTPGIRFCRGSGRTERSSWTLPSRSPPLHLCLSTSTMGERCSAQRAAKPRLRCVRCSPISATTPRGRA